MSRSFPTQPAFKSLSLSLCLPHSLPTTYSFTPSQDYKGQNTYTTCQSFIHNCFPSETVRCNANKMLIFFFFLFLFLSSTIRRAIQGQIILTTGSDLSGGQRMAEGRMKGRRSSHNSMFVRLCNWLSLCVISFVTFETQSCKILKNKVVILVPIKGFSTVEVEKKINKKKNYSRFSSLKL